MSVYTPDRLAAEHLERARPGASRLAGLLDFDRREAAQLLEDERRLERLRVQLARTKNKFSRCMVQLDIDAIELTLRKRQLQRDSARRMWQRVGLDDQFLP